MYYAVAIVFAALFATCNDSNDRIVAPNQTKPAPGPSAEGWQSDSGSGKSACGAAEESMQSLAHVKVGATTIYAGSHQVSKTNRNPFIARFDEGEKIYCLYHEEQDPDTDVKGLTWNGGDYAYVVYETVGGGTELEGKGGWIESYAPGSINGGGKNVSYIGKVHVASGALEKGTFIIAVRSDNKVNSHFASGPVTVLKSGNVEFLGESAHKPIGADGRNSMQCVDYPFWSKYVLTSNLDSLICAECTNCTAQLPCD